MPVSRLRPVALFLAVTAMMRLPRAGPLSSQTSLLPYRGHWALQETFVRSGVHLRWGTYGYELMRQTFRPRSLEKVIGVIKISAVALTRETVSAKSN